MAQPPDITETFVREVDENLRRDRLRDLSKKYAGWIVTAVVLFLAAAGGFIYWENHRLEQSEKGVEQLAQIYADAAQGKTASAPQQLDGLAKQGREAVRATALFDRAGVALSQGDQKLALTKYREIAGDDSLAQPFRDLALIRQTALEFDRLTPEQVINRMAPLAKPGAPWFGSAGEMTAMAMIKQGRKAEAGRLFAAIARDTQVPETIRARAVQIASTLGVDASSAMPPPAQ